MLRSEHIKLEIDRLLSQTSEKKTFLHGRRASALAHYEVIKRAIPEFVKHRHAEIQAIKRQGTQAAQDAFARRLSELKTTLGSYDGITYAPWADSLWASFDIESHQPAYDLSRLGAFLAKGKHDSLELPAMFSILGGRNVLLRADGVGREQGRRLLRNIAFRLLASAPPGNLRFLFIDPVELGSTAAGLVGALPDFLTGGTAWHREQDIEDQLSLMETRIAAIKTKGLGIRFSSLEQYNGDSKTRIKEPYWLVIVADCPVRFRDAAIQKLVSIARNGPKAGVYLAIMLDETQKECTSRLAAC